MAWGGVGGKGHKSKLHIFRCTMTSQYYKDTILDKYAIPFYNKIKEDYPDAVKIMTRNTLPTKLMSNKNLIGSPPSHLPPAAKTFNTQGNVVVQSRILVKSASVPCQTSCITPLTLQICHPLRTCGAFWNTKAGSPTPPLPISTT